MSDLKFKVIESCGKKNKISAQVAEIGTYHIILV
jgi:hypothetical protein